jgi:hypothetical protein
VGDRTWLVAVTWVGFALAMSAVAWWGGYRRAMWVEARRRREAERVLSEHCRAQMSAYLDSYLSGRNGGGHG